MRKEIQVRASKNQNCNKNISLSIFLKRASSQIIIFLYMMERNNAPLVGDLMYTHSLLRASIFTQVVCAVLTGYFSSPSLLMGWGL